MSTVTIDQVRKVFRDYFANQSLGFISRAANIDWIDLEANKVKIKGKPETTIVEVELLGAPRTNSIKIFDKNHPENKSQMCFKSLDVLTKILPDLLSIETLLPAPTSPPSNSDDPVAIIAELRQLLMRILKTC